MKVCNKFTANSPQIHRKFTANSPQIREKRGKPFIILLLFLMNFSNIFSQDFLIESALTDSELTTNQLEKKDKFENSIYTESVTLVEIGDLPTMQEDGILKLQIPDQPEIFTFKVERVSTLPNGDYTWSGDLVGMDSLGYLVDENNTDGSIIILKRGDAIFGDLRIYEDSYRLKDLGDGVSAFIKIDKEEFSEENFCGNSNGDSDIENGEGDISGYIQNNDVIANSNNIALSERDEEDCIVRLLVLYTEAAQNAQSDIENFIDVQYENLQDILPKSKIHDDDLQILMVNKMLLSADIWVESDDSGDDAFDLSMNEDILNYRSEYAADIVIVFTDEVYDGVKGEVVAVGEDETFHDKAFGVVTIGAVSSESYVFAHEIGHLFGARHEGTDICFGGGDDEDPEHAHGYIMSKNFINIKKTNKRTIMARCENKFYGAVKHYSNPNVKWKNKATGKEDTNYNAKVLRDEACRVADYVTSSTFGAIIGGLTEACLGDIVELFAQVTGDSDPFTFEWQTSTDGFNYGTVQSTDFSFSVPVEGVLGGKIFIKLTTTNVFGNEVIDFHAIDIIEDQLACERSSHQSNNDSEKPFFTKFQIYPNPAYSQVSLGLSYEKDLIYDVKFIDITGKVVKSTILKEKSMIDISVLQAGIYAVICKNEKQGFSSKLAIIK